MYWYFTRYINNLVKVILNVKRECNYPEWIIVLLPEEVGMAKFS